VHESVGDAAERGGEAADPPPADHDLVDVLARHRRQPLAGRASTIVV
jgi:hypothetical protein